MSSICGTTRCVAEYIEHNIQLHACHYAIWMKIMLSRGILYYIFEYVYNIIETTKRYKNGQKCICCKYGYDRMNFIQKKYL